MFAIVYQPFFERSVVEIMAATPHSGGFKPCPLLVHSLILSHMDLFMPKNMARLPA
jgi:hypothetical protein